MSIHLVLNMKNIMLAITVFGPAFIMALVGASGAFWICEYDYRSTTPESDRVKTPLYISILLVWPFPAFILLALWKLFFLFFSVR